MLSQMQIDDLLDYVNVKKRRWKSNNDAVQITCPICNENNPSCGVSVSKQIFHCFSCGQAGTFDYFLFKSLPDEFKRISDAREFLRTRYKIDVYLFADEKYKSRIMRYEDFFSDELLSVAKKKEIYHAKIRQQTCNRPLQQPRKTRKSRNGGGFFRKIAAVQIRRLRQKIQMG